jgi:hypothetical protein
MQNTPNTPTEKQVAFLRTLLAERAGINAAEMIRAELNAHREAGTLTRKVVSGAIDTLCQIKVRRESGQQYGGECPDVAEGYYAVASATGSNDLDFYRVDRPTEGRWAGRVFVKRVIGGHADTPVRGKEAHEALVRIAVDADAAARLYGQEIGRCGRCNRHLTDDESRAYGIGPKCRQGGRD